MENRTEPLSRMRRIISERMCASLSQTAQFTLTRETDVDALLQYMKAQKAGGRTVKFMPALIKITAEALKESPRLNAAIKEDTVVYHSAVNMGVAVALEDGILVPVIPDAGTKPVEEVAASYDALIPKAKAGRLRATEMSGGTFTISNLGMIGIDAFTPIVNYPEAGILGVGRIREQLCLDGGALRQKNTVIFSLSMDHRLVDGYVGAQFLDALAGILSNGERLSAILRKAETP